MIFLKIFGNSNDVSVSIADIWNLSDNKRYIAGRVKENAGETGFFRQPAALWVDWLIESIGADTVWENGLCLHTAKV